MARDLNGSIALMLGEMRSDIKWLVNEMGETKQIVSHHARILSKPRRERIAWGPLLQYAAGILPLGLALGHLIPWAEAVSLAQGFVK